MKIAIVYPSLNIEKGCPTLGQNRQFQYFKTPTYIYPVVPAQAATLLKQSGHEVLWLDCIAQNISYEKLVAIIQKEKPDIIAMETKTPVIKQEWKIIDDLKKGDGPIFLEKIGPSPFFVLFGDHVTALPEESFQNSKVDFVLTGGDYDFLLVNLCDFLKKRGQAPAGTVPFSQLESGIYYRDLKQGQSLSGTVPVLNTGKFQLNHDLNSLLFIDRELTHWQDYAYKNGNYKRTPGTYIMSGRDCWWSKCTFCSWPTLYPEFRSRSTQNVLDEIGVLIGKYAVKEIMDDSGCFPAGDWLKEFCQGMITRGFNKKIYFDCNMRFGALSPEDFKLMKKANFRLLLFGLESANQKTLDRIKKNLNAERIVEDCKAATQAGLFPHITIMFGYPWESYEDAVKTLELGKYLLKSGYAYTMQATVVIPYPGTPLFEECKKERSLLSDDWEDYDMKQPIMKTVMGNDAVMGLARQMYKVSFSPEFIRKKIFSIRDTDDIKYYLRAGRKVFGHIFDFRKGKKGTVLTENRPLLDK